jgi:hypothetical protein
LGVELGALPSAAPPSATAPAEPIPADPLLAPLAPEEMVPDVPPQVGCGGQFSLMLWVTSRTFESSDWSEDAWRTKSLVIALWAMSLRMRVTRTFGPDSPTKSVVMSSARTCPAVSPASGPASGLPIGK